jgi:hypothetical protein
LQAVLDEYAHVLVDALGQKGRHLEDIAENVSNEIAAALRTRTANLGVDYIHLDAKARRVSLQSSRGAFRTRFAVRFGARASEDGASAERDDVVRRAFNSPFWPFVLCSTSVGQEGLDFHQYCHAVVHWNVPSNPVDLEQREGRVHRYKNHAVRKNVATAYRRELRQTGHPDAWHRLFRLAEAGRAGESDLTPYWVFATENGAQIERHVPVYLLSTDSDRAVRVRRSLAVYRLAFGQSRQEDLVAYLTSTLSPEEINHAVNLLRIDLSPPPLSDGASPGSLENDEARSSERGYVLPSTRNGNDDVDLDSIHNLIDRFSELDRTRHKTPTAGEITELLNQFQELSRELAGAVSEP